ncbi:hypothetical protein GCM10007036_14640 [Alsobacter metallidurans]|uniref:Uncharacterized protein n=1 Tax=Alsobacter metallidurans TaxID=340221 RepID=A0A917I5N7_9HYPH|nr:hypothetical protein [Alsobacter metallidurans]GGH14978.1 hypothetical protein GCM10007036_14640 [Alsobacter metallidurans]
MPDREPDPKVLLLDNKVTGLERQVDDLAKTTARGLADIRQDTHQQLTAMRTENTGEFRAITSAIGDLQKTIAGNAGIRGAQIWPAIGAMTAVLGLVGGILYWPIKDSIVELRTSQKDTIGAINERMVPRAEHAEKWRQNEHDNQRLEERIDRLENMLLRRN